MPQGVGVRVSSSSLLFAEIAQLVEHDLAKVGVAGSSPVFRSFLSPYKTLPMNIYVRYFNNEALFETLTQVLDFLTNVAGVSLDSYMVQEISDYVAATGKSFPKRFKVSSHTYFIIIKTRAKSLEEFKDNANGEERTLVSDEKEKDTVQSIFSVENPGWYKATIAFKRVVPVDDNASKFQYVDTEFEVKLKAHSVRDCYDRVVNYLRTRDDVDMRSQFPSIKGRNFHSEFLGMC